MSVPLFLREESEIFDENIDGEICGFFFCGSFSCFQETEECAVESPTISAIAGFAVVTGFKNILTILCLMDRASS